LGEKCKVCGVVVVVTTQIHKKKISGKLERITSISEARTYHRMSKTPFSSQKCKYRKTFKEIWFSVAQQNRVF